jgi:formylglycine-generating enzyme required for sulfatase activity
MTKFALLIGVSEYLAGGLNHLRSLPSALVDVDVLAVVLGDPQRGGFPAENITVLKNPDVQQMRDAIYRLFYNRQKNDLILLYFSGHGIKDDRNDLYLATKITRKNDDDTLDQPSAVPATDLHNWMKYSISQHQVIILDCCYSGAIAKGMTGKDDGIVRVKDYFGGKGTAILTSSTSIEYSLSPEPIDSQNTQPSIYTRYLVEGLTTGAADLDKDGEISADELHEYVAKKVKEVAPSMTPKFFPAQEGYKLLLSKAPHNDRKLEYEQKVQEYADKDRGNLSRLQKKLLIIKQQEWGISPSDAQIIEDRVFQPYLEYEEKLKAYKEALTELVQSHYPLSARDRADLQEYQQELKLRDKDIAEIERRVLSQVHPTQPTISLSTFSFETAQVKVNSGLFAGTKIEIIKTPSQAQHFVEELGNGVKLEMVYVPGGQFMMGSDDRQFEEYLNQLKKDLSWTQANIDDYLKGYDERPQHSVNVPSFLMSKYPVTQAQYETIIGSNPSNFKGSQRPVEQVSWDDAQAFCQKLTKQTNKAYRLPSEAEWEYACRAGTKTPFYFGATISPDVVNYDGNYPYGNAPKGVYRETTTDVGSFPANSFGLYDIHGNVWEWCLDTWHENYQAAPTDGSAWINENNYQVLRGGSWISLAKNCRSAHRNWGTPGLRFYNFGFRLALPLSPGLP